MSELEKRVIELERLVDLLYNSLAAYGKPLKSLLKSYKKN